jgi:response regulator RpfG family c-di-GMP phosphodiesterase/serine/threonine protein kinase
MNLKTARFSRFMLHAPRSTQRSANTRVLDYVDGVSNGVDADRSLECVLSRGSRKLMFTTESHTFVDTPSRRALAATRPGSSFLEDLLKSGLILSEDWEAIPELARTELRRCIEPRELLSMLARSGLLTDYQAARLESGKTFGLMLGNYRILDHLGSGGMGVVYRAEHIHLRRQAAIKVFTSTSDQDPVLLHRFYSEIRAVSRLAHPNVIGALDVGEVVSSDSHTPNLHYFVMEYAPGQNLDQLVRAHGPMPIAQACDVAHQVANALAEAHKHQLVHRDIKPSNIQLTPEGQAKLLDFGLARLLCHRVTRPGIMMGSVEYVAPEQVRDASAVDIRADIYALGATLFWCLSGRPPFQGQSDIAASLARRCLEEAPDIRTLRPSVPVGLEAILNRLLAIHPEDRYATPAEVSKALLPYLRADLREHERTEPATYTQRLAVGGANGQSRQILIVDDADDVREFCKTVLETEGFQCDEAANGVLALEATQGKRFDLVLLDIDMPRMNGREVLRHLRENPPCPHLKVIMFSGRADGDDMAELLLAGADDYLTKPFTIIQLQARIKSALRFKDAQDRSDLLNQHLLATNRELDKDLSLREINLVHTRNSMVMALSKLVEYRDSETGQHLIRLQHYCRCLAEEAAQLPLFAEQITPDFINMLVSCVPLHDIGKAMVPDHILLKPGKLDSNEQIIMQRHTVAGRDALAGITLQQGWSLGFWQMAVDIVSYHHERYDGTGYPDQLVGSDIPLAARIVAIADVYDALRSRRVYKPALSHATAFQVLTKASTGQFDPAIIGVFTRCALQFDQIFRDYPD